MTRIWKFLPFCALCLALAAPPMLRASDPEKKPLTDSEKLDLLMRDLAATNRQIGELKTEIKDARTDAELRFQAMEGRLRSMTDRLDRVEKDAVTRRSSYFEPAPVVAPVGTGTVVLQNTYSDVATVFLNGRGYTVPPGQVLTLPNQPTGAYTYEVVVNGYGTIRGPVTRVLESNRKLQIEVYAAPLLR